MKKYLLAIGALGMSSVQQLEAKQVALPKVADIPEVAIPKVKIPKVSVPKVSVPKVKVPKVSVPKITIPKLTVPKVSVPKITLPKIKIPNINIKSLTSTLEAHFGKQPAVVHELNIKLGTLLTKMPKVDLPHLGTMLNKLLPNPKDLKDFINTLAKMGPEKGGSAVAELAALEIKLKTVEAELTLAENEPAQFAREARKLKGLISTTLIDLLQAQANALTISSVYFTHNAQDDMAGKIYTLIVKGVISGKKFTVSTKSDPALMKWDDLPKIIADKIASQLSKPPKP